MMGNVTLTNKAAAISNRIIQNSSTGVLNNSSVGQKQGTGATSRTRRFQESQRNVALNNNSMSNVINPINTQS